MLIKLPVFKSLMISLSLLNISICIKIAKMSRRKTDRTQSLGLFIVHSPCMVTVVMMGCARTINSCNNIFSIKVSIFFQYTNIFSRNLWHIFKYFVWRVSPFVFDHRRNFCEEWKSALEPGWRSPTCTGVCRDLWWKYPFIFRPCRNSYSCLIIQKSYSLLQINTNIIMFYLLSFAHCCTQASINSGRLKTFTISPIINPLLCAKLLQQTKWTKIGHKCMVLQDFRFVKQPFFTTYVI